MHQSLSDQFASLGTKFSDGLTQGKPAKQTRDASEMKGLEFLQTNDMQHFHIPNNLPIYDQSSAQWPRSRDTYRAPLLIVKEMVVGHPRALVAVADRDVVFTDSFFAASLPSSHKQSAHLLAAILSSALASWFFSLTAIYKRKLLRRDVGVLPVPDLHSAAKSQAGRRLLDLEKVLRKQEIGAQEWSALDEAVFDFYEFSGADRAVVLDGLLRAGWQWEDGREASVVPSDSRLEVAAYAETFLSVMNGWFSARKKRHMRAEVMDLPRGATLRVVRFVVEDGPGEGSVSFVSPQGELHDVLTRIGQRLKVKIATALSAERELRVHGRNAQKNSSWKLIVLPGTESRSKSTVVLPDGRTDIPLMMIEVFLRTQEHDPHAIIECKRIAGSDTHLCRKYVVEGVDRFASGKYGENHAVLGSWSAMSSLVRRERLLQASTHI